jgi:cobaltochelatase CobT
MKPTTGDNFKQATAITLRAIAGDGELQVDFGADTPGLDDKNATLPDIATCEDIPVLRGQADAIALTAACHDPILHRKLTPASGAAKLVFEAMEAARIEAIGAQAMPGMARNMGAVLERKFSEPRFAGMNSRETAPLEHALAFMLLENLTTIPLPENARNITNAWRSWVSTHAGELLLEMAGKLNDQREFATSMHEIITALDLMESDHDPEQEVASGADEPGEQDASPDTQDGADQHTSDLLPTESGSTEGNAEATDLATDLDSRDYLDKEISGEQTSSANSWPQNISVLSAPEAFGYKVFTSEFDEVVAAENLCDAEELDFLRKALDTQLQNQQRTVARMANRLQRFLLARQNRAWDFDMDEGMLDAARLTRIITDPACPLSFKRERDTEFRDTVVSILVDNSGSMRGRPIMTAACCGDILARTLERCGVKVEILGFTTTAWKGGEARKVWEAEGKPEQPGRLNDLRHIIYKSADTPWRRSRQNMGLMLREGLLKENIDGEALAWAHHRLLFRPEQRKVLMVISDGAPIDDSTLSVNSGTYLEAHLRQIIEEIETRSETELLAIGIGHDVNRYYRKAVTISDVDELAGAMTENLVELFKPETGIKTR